MITKITVSLLLSLSLFIGSYAADLTYDDYGKLPSYSMLKVSPTGKRLAYRSVSGGQDMLLVIDMATKELVSGVNITDVNPDNIHFIDDNRLILTVSKNTRLYGYRGRHDVSAAFSFNIDTKKLFQLLIPGYGIYSGQNGLGRIVGISADKEFAYMAAWKTASQYSLFKVNLTKKRKPRVHKKGTADTIDYFVDDQGEILARERYHQKKNRHILESRQGDQWVKIFEQQAEIQTVSFSGITPNGKSLMMKRHLNQGGRWAYHTISLKDGTISEPIFSRKDRDVDYLLTDINRVVYGAAFSGFKPSYQFFDDKLNQRLAGVNAALPDNAMKITSHTPDWSNILFYLTGTDSSGEYLRYYDGKLSMIARARPVITTDKVHPVTITAFNARDGLTIPTLLTLPLNTKTNNLPAIVLPHGGPESYDKLDFDWLSQYFASQGYVVIQPQFRGSSGFGTRHKHLGRGEWGRKMQDDLTDAVKHYADEGMIDPQRICIVGGSYGGYAALAGATFTPDLYRCVVSVNGISDIERMMKTDRRQYGRYHWVVSYWDRVIANGNLEDDHLENISPINFVKRITAPVLLVHGEHDSVVNVRQSRNMFDEMEDEHKAVTYVELDNGDHYLSKGPNRAKALEAIATFVNKHLK